MVLGAARLQRQNPHTQPNRIKKSPAPRFHAFSVAVLKALRDAYSAFAAAFRAASQRLRSGDRGGALPGRLLPAGLTVLLGLTDGEEIRFRSAGLARLSVPSYVRRAGVGRLKTGWTVRSSQIGDLGRGHSLQPADLKAVTAARDRVTDGARPFSRGI